MPTNFTSGRFAGALTVVGLLTAGTVVFTTLTVGTGNFTTLNAQTVSGSVIRAGSSFTGATLTVVNVGAGSGRIAVHGGAGSYHCLTAANGKRFQFSISNAGVAIINGANTTTCP